MKKLGKHIKRRRQRVGLTQGQLAKRIGVTRSAMANFENGHRKISKHYLAQIKKQFQRIDSPRHTA
jgi:transcriptional regulator with XRE-family HTH domain